jgi:uncharacterized membrane protein
MGDGLDSEGRDDALPRGERRWPPAIAILILITMPLLLPRHLFPLLLWVIVPIELGLLVALLIGDPGRIDRVSHVLRRTEVLLTFLLVFVAGAVTVLLVVELVDGAPHLRQASTLLEAGGLVWVSTNLAFALLYWELDGGGSAERLHHFRAHPDFAFPEHANPHLAHPGWRPIFVDYLYLGFTNATAFSPTDVMPLARWAKMAMAVQAILSLVILSLVIANAVNILGS